MRRHARRGLEVCLPPLSRGHRSKNIYSSVRPGLVHTDNELSQCVGQALRQLVMIEGGSNMATCRLAEGAAGHFVRRYSSYNNAQGLTNAK